MSGASPRVHFWCSTLRSVTAVHLDLVLSSGPLVYYWYYHTRGYDDVPSCQFSKCVWVGALSYGEGFRVSGQRYGAGLLCIVLGRFLLFGSCIYYRLFFQSTLYLIILYLFDIVIAFHF